MSSYTKVTTHKRDGFWQWVLTDTGELVDSAGGFTSQSDARLAGNIAKRQRAAQQQCTRGWELTDSGIRRK